MDSVNKLKSDVAFIKFIFVKSVSPHAHICWPVAHFTDSVTLNHEMTVPPSESNQVSLLCAATSNGDSNCNKLRVPTK